jgi:hypothetical protein
MSCPGPGQQAQLMDKEGLAGNFEERLGNVADIAAQPGTEPTGQDAYRGQLVIGRCHRRPPARLIISPALGGR